MINLKKEMAIRNLSVKDLALEAGVSPSLVYSMLNNEVSVKKSVLSVLERVRPGEAVFAYTITAGSQNSKGRTITVLARSYSEAMEMAELEWHSEGYYINEKGQYLIKRSARVY